MAHIPLYQPNRPTKRKLTLRQRVALLAAAGAPLAIAGSVLGYGLNLSGGGASGSPLMTFTDSDPSARLAQILGSRPAPAPAPAPVPAAAPLSMPAPKPSIPPAPSPLPAPVVQDAGPIFVPQPIIASVKAATVVHAVPAPPPANPTPAASPPSPAPAVVPPSQPPALTVRVPRPVLPEPVLPARVRPVAPLIVEVRPPRVALPKGQHGEKTRGNKRD